MTLHLTSSDFGRFERSENVSRITMRTWERALTS